MAKLNHTAAPWTVDPKLLHYAHPEKMVWGPRGPGFGVICETSHPHDALIIAMAPDLYEACEEFVDMVEKSSHCGKFLHSYLKIKAILHDHKKA